MVAIETVDRIEPALLDDRFDRGVVRLEALTDARLALSRAQIAIARNGRAVADFRYQVASIEMAITIDH